MISFLMMAKNVEAFIGDAIERLITEDHVNWELIIVDDNSSDATFEIASNFAARDPRVLVYRNPFIGKVKGTSFAFAKSRGTIIKCIDSDDILDSNFFEFSRLHAKHDVLFHSGKIVDEKLTTLATYHPSSAWMTSSFKDVAERMISFPKWAWSFNRTIAEKIFPLPEQLPFEDVWMSLMCKKYAQSPWFTRQPLYLYRQHGNQTYGGILNFSKASAEFRAGRLLNLINALESEPRLEHSSHGISFSSCRKENLYLSGQTSIFSTVLEPFSVKRTIRLLMMGRAPTLLAKLAIRQWEHESRYTGWSPEK